VTERSWIQVLETTSCVKNRVQFTKWWDPDPFPNPAFAGALCTATPPNHIFVLSNSCTNVSKLDDWLMLSLSLQKLYACVFMFYSSVSHHFVERVLVFMQAVVDEWASSLFRVCIGFLVFSSKLCSSVYMIAWCSYSDSSAPQSNLSKKKKKVNVWGNSMCDHGLLVFWIFIFFFFFCIYYHNYSYCMFGFISQ
jgi:hypothetical protein